MPKEPVCQQDFEYLPVTSIPDRLSEKVCLPIMPPRMCRKICELIICWRIGSFTMTTRAVNWIIVSIFHWPIWVYNLTWTAAISLAAHLAIVMNWPTISTVLCATLEVSIYCVLFINRIGCNGCTRDIDCMLSAEQALRLATTPLTPSTSTLANGIITTTRQFCRARRKKKTSATVTCCSTRGVRWVRVL